MKVREQVRKIITDTYGNALGKDKIDDLCYSLCVKVESIIDSEVARRTNAVTSKSNTDHMFAIVQRIVYFPLFFGLAAIGTAIMFIKYVVNYIRYGGEAISYTKKTNRKTIDDVFCELVKQRENTEFKIDKEQ